jgi:hypothetical protein
MTQYRILYRWSGRDYATVVPGYSANQALMMAPNQIIAGAQVFAVEVNTP